MSTNTKQAVAALKSALGATKKEVEWDGGKLRLPIDKSVQALTKRLENGESPEDAVAAILDETAPTHTAWQLANTVFNLELQKSGGSLVESIKEAAESAKKKLTAKEE